MLKDAELMDRSLWLPDWRQKACPLTTDDALSLGVDIQRLGSVWIRGKIKAGGAKRIEGEKRA